MELFNSEQKMDPALALELPKIELTCSEIDSIKRGLVNKCLILKNDDLENESSILIIALDDPHLVLLASVTDIKHGIFTAEERSDCVGNVPTNVVLTMFTVQNIRIMSRNRPIPAPPVGHKNYDTIYFSGSSGSLGVVAVSATDIQLLRNAIRNDPGGRNVAKTELVQASTTITVDQKQAGRNRSIATITFNSLPSTVYATADVLEKDPETVKAENEICFPWRGNRFIFTKGREAVRFLICRFFGHLIVVYERKIITVPIEVNYDDNGNQHLISKTIIFSAEITIKLLEAASCLLREEGNYALIGIYAPHTSCITSNTTTDFVVIQTNVKSPFVKKSELSFDDRKDVYAYMRASWRNFVHVRAVDGSQFVIYHPRVQQARRIAALPLANIDITQRSDYGTNYIACKLSEAAHRVIDQCSKNAVFEESKKGQPLFSSQPLFFDANGSLRYDELMNVLKNNFREVIADNGDIYLVIEDHLLSTLDHNAPVSVKYDCTAESGVQGLILNENCTGKAIFEGYMERFLRSIISAIYVCYGSSNSAIAHRIYRAALAFITKRSRAFTLLNEGFGWLMKRSFPPESQLNLLIGITKTHTRQKPPRLHQQLLIGYVMNRSTEAFLPLVDELLLLFNQWSLDSIFERANEVIEAPKQQSSRIVVTAPQEQYRRNPQAAQRNREGAKAPAPAPKAAAKAPALAPLSSLETELLRAIETEPHFKPVAKKMVKYLIDNDESFRSIDSFKRIEAIELMRKFTNAFTEVKK